MKLIQSLGLAVGIVLCFSILRPSPVHSQDFAAYEGKNALREGEGGTKKTVNGIDFWEDGAPPRQFKLLGYISDRRHKTGLVGMFRMAGLEGDIADVAKKNGGDAVILMKSEAETVGIISNSTGSATGTATTNGGTTNARASGWSSTSSSAVQKQQSKYAVVKYVEQEKPKASEAPSAPPAAAKPADEPKPTPSQPPSN